MKWQKVSMKRLIGIIVASVVQILVSCSSDNDSSSGDLWHGGTTAPSSSSALPTGSSSSYDGLSSSVHSSSSVVFSSSSFVFSSSSAGGFSSSSIEFGSVTYQGQTYKTVNIGNQTWMAENLNYAATGSKCYGEDGVVVLWDGNKAYGVELSLAEIQANCAKYGRLYDWGTAMNLSDCNSSNCSGKVQAKHRGICPVGWHIPTDAEWTTLMDYVGGSSTAGTKLKANHTWAGSGLIEGTDDFGFSALPGGNGNALSAGNFYNVGEAGYWWSATEYGSSFACDRNMDNYRAGVFGDNDCYSLKTNWFSVRCLRD